MVDNGLGLTIIPEMAVAAGLLNGTDVQARPLNADHATREIALIWRTNSPRREEFELLAEPVVVAGFGINPDGRAICIMLFLPKWRVCFQAIDEKRGGLKRVCPVPRRCADADHGFAHGN
eukprot:gene8162-11049_t